MAAHAVIAEVGAHGVAHVVAAQRVRMAEDHLAVDRAGVERVVGRLAELDLAVVADDPEHAAVAPGVTALADLERHPARRRRHQNRRLPGARDVGRVDRLQLAEHRRARREDERAAAIDDHVAVGAERQVAFRVAGVVVEDDCLLGD